MTSLRGLAILVASIIALGTVVPSAQAVDCGIDGLLVYCNGSDVHIQWGNDVGAGCSPATVNLQRRLPGQSKWTTVASGISAPYDYSPGSSTTYEYRLQISCSPCSGTGYSDVFTIGCP
jgi:hypothetical protein